MNDDLDSMSDDELAEALCAALEPNPPIITARQARANVPGFVSVSCHDYRSPKGWWVAEIGTDHGPDSADDVPVRWRPLPELADLIERAWLVVEEMKDRGWLMHILVCTDGYVVNGREYELPEDGDWSKSMLQGGMVQEAADTAPRAICLAALRALRKLANKEP